MSPIVLQLLSMMKNKAYTHHISCHEPAENTGICSNIIFIIFHIIYDYTIKGASDKKNKDLISTDSMLI